MCGIAGMMMRDGSEPDSGVLDRLERALRHRGPDSAGRHVAHGVALISTRLAIMDVAEGDQPLFGPEGLALVCNGEVYNAPELRAELGGAFATLSDCEPALRLYSADDLDFARRMRGMYAAALHDPARSRLVLARDPFGIKPLYFVQTDTLFAFASEPQALIAAGLAMAAPTRGKAAELLQLKFTTGAQTIFPSIRRVLPGETLAVEGARIVDRRRISVGGRRSRTHAADLERVLSDSVAVHLRSDVPYGLFLSGGVDSTVLLALMRRLTGARVTAVTVGYAPHDGVPDPADESVAAQRVAGLLGADCHRVEIGAADFWAHAPRIAAAIDDPTTDSAVVPTWFLGRESRRMGLKVALCGEGADELFAGYGRYRRLRPPLSWLRPAGARGVFDRAGMGATLAGWGAGIAAVRAREAAGASPLQAELAIDRAEWLPNDLLTKLDRCLMAHGVEGRTPFLDPLVAAFADGLPDRARIGRRMGKLILREFLAEICPEAGAFARKKGFNPPIGRWMAARHPELAALVAAQPGVAPLLPAADVARAMAAAEHDPQPAWSLLFYALWHTHHVLGRRVEGDIAAVLADAADRPILAEAAE